MTLGELYDKLNEITEAGKEVDEARRSLLHGGSPATIKGKQEVLECRKRYLNLLRDQPTNFYISET